MREAPGAIQTEAPMLALGTVISAVTAFAAVKWLMGFLQSNTFVAFGWYRIALGAIILVIAYGSA